MTRHYVSSKQREGRTLTAAFNGTWTAERLAMLTQLFHDGDSFARIAAAINLKHPGAGLTRNACLGKATRLGLKRDATTTAMNAKRSVGTRLDGGWRAPKPAAAPQSAPEIRAQAKVFGETMVPKAEPIAPPIIGKPPQRPRVFSIPATAVTLADIGKRACRWPVGADPGRGNGHRQLFCGAPAPEGQTYCDRCKPRAYRASRTPEQQAADELRAATMRLAKGNARGLTDIFFPQGRKGAAA